MNKLLPTILCAAVLFGCRTHPVTPDESWADYNRYYNATGETAAVPAGAADIRVVPSKNADATVESLKAQGYVVLGTFKIDDGTEISWAAVSALAQKLNAGAAVWSTVNALPTSSRTLQNPDMGVVGVDKTQMAHMNADRPDQTFAEQVIEQHHTIYMLGKKGK